ncbi:glycosyltransferase family 4 protein [Micromonospora sp. DT233]|uniref:glycosyltransferase family 4 protein n=1 Tax=Micromonospora sp. DT233 TaxID=3393432 RepID=UPI003CF71A5E
MTLTVVSSYFPLPPDRGDPVRVSMMLRALARLPGCTLLAVRRPDTTADQVEQLRRMLAPMPVHTFAATPFRYDRLGPPGRYAQSLARGLPPWIRSRYSAELHHELRRRDGAGLALGEAAGAYFPTTGLRWHWDKANVLAASARQEIAAARDPVHRLRARYLTTVSTRFERRALARCATVSVTSADEADRLRRHHGRSATFVLPSCVPLPADHRPRPRQRELVWLGSFAYEPNLSGLRRFLAQGWPPLARGGFTLSLIGSGLTVPLRAELGRHRGVLVRGYVEDLRPALAGARAGVVPLFSGAGVKLKTLTLLAHAVPVFTTPVGAEGIPVSPAVRVAPDPAALTGQLLAATPADLDAMAGEATRLVRREFSEARFAERLLAALDAAARPASEAAGPAPEAAGRAGPPG